MRIHKKQYLKWTQAFDYLLGPLLSKKKDSLEEVLTEASRQVWIVENFRIGDSIMARPAIHALVEGFRKKGFSRVGLIASQTSRVFLEDFSWNRVVELSPRWGGGQESLTQLLLKHRSTFTSNDILIDVRGDARNLFLWKLLGVSTVLAPVDGGLSSVVSLSLGKTDLPEYPHQVEQCFAVPKKMGFVGQGEKTPSPSWKQVKEKKQNHVKKIALHLESSLEAKNWSTQKWVQFLELASKETVIEELHLFCTNTFAEAKIFSSMPKTKIRMEKLSNIPNALLGLDAFLGVDSFMGHLAGALNLPVLTLFGSASNPTFCKPYYAHAYQMKAETMNHHDPRLVLDELKKIIG